MRPSRPDILRVRAPASGPAKSTQSAATTRIRLLLQYWTTIAAVALVLATCAAPARAYIPAQATNETSVAQAAGQNFSDVSRLDLQWYPMSSYSETVSYQLVGADSNGISKVRASISGWMRGKTRGGVLAE